jgi:hypothetical protein
VLLGGSASPLTTVSRPRRLTAEEALAYCLRRIFLPLLTALLATWAMRVIAYSEASWPASAAVGQLSGLAVTTAAVVVTRRPRTWRSRDELQSRM